MADSENPKRIRDKDQFSCRLTEEMNEWIRRCAHYENIQVKDLAMHAFEDLKKKLGNKEYPPIPPKKKRLTKT